MKEIKKVILCGLGAIGTIYADKLEKFDAENFKVLVDEARIERYKTNTNKIKKMGLLLWKCRWNLRFANSFCSKMVSV